MVRLYCEAHPLYEGHGDPADCDACKTLRSALRAGRAMVSPLMSSGNGRLSVGWAP